MPSWQLRQALEEAPGWVMVPLNVGLLYRMKVVVVEAWFHSGPAPAPALCGVWHTMQICPAAQA